MENNLRFGTDHLTDFLQGLGSRFALVSEIPFQDRGEEPALFAEEAFGVNANQLAGYAAGLGGRGLENLVFALFQAGESGLEPSKGSRLLEILELRMSKRLVKIIWQFYQVHYQDDNPWIRGTLNLGADFCKREGTLIPEAEMISIFTLENGREQIVAMLNLQNFPINTFAGEYKFNLESPLIRSIARKYLEQCEKAGYNFNEAWMNRLIQSENPLNLPKLVINYLNAFDEEEYFESVNINIFERMGYPGTSAEWKDIPEELRRKFSNWNSLRLLGVHFKRKGDKKYLLLSKYIEFFKKVSFLRGDQLLILDFKDFVILDDIHIKDYSYLMDKGYFEGIREKLELDAALSFRSDREVLLQPREYILEETDSEVYQLDFREVGKLYIEKTLDIMLGLVMDTRPSKSILKTGKFVR